MKEGEKGMSLIYDRAKELWANVQREQIEKGMEKYGTPLNPDDWTNEQLLNHAVQENVDQMHYMTSLYEKLSSTTTEMRVRENEIKKLRRENQNLKQYFVELELLAQSDVGMMLEKLATLAKHAKENERP
jgi:hypothetical protein